jgi:phosphotriesterase-related protein
MGIHFVQTVTGPLPISEMGRTLIHEHVCVGVPGWQFDVKAPRTVRSELIARAVDKLQELQARGCKTIVDPCPMDLGRDVEFIAEVASRSGTNIICATGVYTEAEGITTTFRTLPREDILELFVKEITQGIGDTGIRAGVVKIASGPDPKNEYETLMLGIATQAAMRTGVPIISHTHLATHGHNQIDIVERHGGHVDCLVVGHSGDRDDPQYQCSLAVRGVFVGLDRFGLEMILADEIRTRNLLQLIQAGHRDRILISQDHALCVLGRLGADMDHIAPNWRITRIFDYVLPSLRAQGISATDIDRILIDNPRALFANALERFGAPRGP